MTTFVTPQPISIHVEIGVGDIRVEASDRTDTVVEVHPSDRTNAGDVRAAEQTQADYSSGRLVIRGPKNWHKWNPFGGRESVQVEIQVPAGSSLASETGVGALHLSGRLGPVDYRTGVGDVTADDCGTIRTKTGMGDVTVGSVAGDADINTSAGRVELRSVSGRAAVKNSNGDTFIGDAGGDVRVQSANGRIVIDSAAASVVAKTAFGDVRLAEISNGTAEASTAYGQVEIGVREGVAAWMDLHTSCGQVRSELDDAAGPEPGQPIVEVKAQTAMGDIAVHRAPLTRPSFGA